MDKSWENSELDKGLKQLGESPEFRSLRACDFELCGGEKLGLFLEEADYFSGAKKYKQKAAKCFSANKGKQITVRTLRPGEVYRRPRIFGHQFGIGHHPHPGQEATSPIAVSAEQSPREAEPV